MAKTILPISVRVFEGWVNGLVCSETHRTTHSIIVSFITGASRHFSSIQYRKTDEHRSISMVQSWQKSHFYPRQMSSGHKNPLSFHEILLVFFFPVFPRAWIIVIPSIGRVVQSPKKSSIFLNFPQVPSPWHNGSVRMCTRLPKLACYRHVKD